MSYLPIYSPVTELAITGIYGNLIHGKPSYTLNYQKDISIVKIIAFSENNVDSISAILKSLLGLVIPEIGYVYTSGTRRILRTDMKTMYVCTEGEARGVLYSRLLLSLKGIAGLFDETSGLILLRIDGYQTFDRLTPLFSHYNLIPQTISSCRILDVDECDIIIHYNSHDSSFVYLPRFHAFELYSRIARLLLPYGLKII